MYQRCTKNKSKVFLQHVCQPENGWQSSDVLLHKLQGDGFPVSMALNCRLNVCQAEDTAAAISLMVVGLAA